MRIIGGELRGRRLVDWEEAGIRPMRDFVRTAMFNILVEFVPGARFLDLFAGTGSVGLEALSRGAASCTFVDRSDGACAIVRRNLDLLGLLDRADVLESDAIEAVSRFARRGRRYDVVFIGPPYYNELASQVLTALADGRALSDDPVVVAEVHSSETVEALYGCLEQVDHRSYGDNQLFIYRRRESEESV
jgi:16S rRNA (guanine(966)-N(2))-methyltransferase RsmD